MEEALHSLHLLDGNALAKSRLPGEGRRNVFGAAHGPSYDLSALEDKHVDAGLGHGLGRRSAGGPCAHDERLAAKLPAHGFASPRAAASTASSRPRSSSVLPSKVPRCASSLLPRS